MTYARSKILAAMLMTVQVGFYLAADSIPDSPIQCNTTKLRTSAKRCIRH